MNHYRSGLFLLLLFLGTTPAVIAQDYWQQQADYEMDIRMNVENHQFEGTQKLVYTNNSDETLDKVFYHLFFNAFQPGSMMDIRSRTIDDPDRRIQDRIFHLDESEIGFQQIQSLTQNGKDVSFVTSGSILEVQLAEPIKPGKKATFNMSFKSQVPVQIRRSGRDNKEGIDYSMAQWYPKMCEFDHEGWHANLYIGREFHGVWGSFDVKIHIDSSYVVGGTGYLQGAPKLEGDQKTWHFKAPGVHDFVWAADPDYRHTTVKGPNDVDMHFYFQPTDSATIANWEALPEKAVQCMEIMNRDFGVYPYKQFSTIQGGDGGMEYPMATLITGEISFPALVSVTVHEMLHNWYQGVLATNETLYPWMDEGFTSYAQNRVLNEIWERGEDNPHLDDFNRYVRARDLDYVEPLTTHSDHYTRNGSYGVAAYTQGALVCAQLEYIMGEEVFLNGMRTYYEQWGFKHPTPTDFKRVMERTSGLELDWFFQYFTELNRDHDYAISTIESSVDTATVYLENKGDSPMPVDILIEYTDGSTEEHYVPIQMMWGERSLRDDEISHSPWPWTFPSYAFQVPLNGREIARLSLDVRNFTVDKDRSNNVYPPAAELNEEEIFIGE